MRRCINLLLLSFAIFFAGDGPLSAQQVEQFVSTADLRLAMKRGAVLSLRKGAVPGDVAIEIDESQRFQSMDGLGRGDVHVARTGDDLHRLEVARLPCRSRC